MRITVRIPDEWAAQLTAACEARGINPPSSGRCGGPSRLLKAILAEELEIQFEDYHDGRERQALVARQDPFDGVDIASIPEWIRRLRQRNGLSQRGLARLTGVHVTNIGRWERGLTVPSPDNLRKIRTAFPFESWPPRGAFLL